MTTEAASKGQLGIFTLASPYKAKNYLLAIAINEYQHMSKLYNCVKDGQDLIRLLTEDFEFERENVRFISSGLYHREFADVVVKPSAEEERESTLEELKNISRHIREWEGLDADQAADLLRELDRMQENVRQSDNPFAHPEKRAQLVARLRELKQAYEKGDDTLSKDDVLKELNNLKKKTDSPDQINRLIKFIEGKDDPLAQPAEHIEIIEALRDLKRPFENEEIKNYLLRELRQLERRILYPGKPATREVIFRELRKIGEQIKADQEADKDLKVNLVVYYSGHGWYDDFLDQGYWITVDSEPDDYSKYISNSTIRDFLNGFKTHHTLLLADSCFSGSLFASGEGKSAATSRLEKDASRWGITAGRNEVVSDGMPGDNSPFAATLIDELKRSDIIGVQDLSVKILEKVAANDKQTPRGEPLRVRGHDGGQFVFRKKANAYKHFEAGKLLLQLAEFQPEYERYRAAAQQFFMALRLAKKPEDRLTFAWWRARALCCAGLLEEAAELLKTTLKEIGNRARTLAPDATAEAAAKTLAGAAEIGDLQAQLGYIYFLLSNGRAQEPAREAIRKEAQTFFGNFPPLPAEKGITTLIGQLQQFFTSKSTVHLVLIGIAEYQQSIPSLAGPPHDVDLIEQTLKEKLSKHRLLIRRLVNQQATQAAIVHALDDLNDQAAEEDLVILYYSGHSGSADLVNQDGQASLLLPYDAAQVHRNGKTYVANCITCEQLHEKMTTLRARSKVLILDIDGNEVFAELANQGDYTMLTGAREKQHSYESSFNGVMHGHFTWSLASAIEEASGSVNMLKRVAAKMDTERQTPLFIRETDFFRRLFEYDQLNKAVDGLYGPVANLSSDDKTGANWAAAIQALPVSFSPVESAKLGRLLSRIGAQREAAAFYEQALSAKPDEYAKDPEAVIFPAWKARLELAQTCLTLRRPDQAARHLKQCRDSAEEMGQLIAASVEKLLQGVKNVSKKPGYALLVGIDRYKEHQEIKPLKSATKDVAQWKNVLMRRGYAEQHITVLLNEEADRKHMLEAFGELAKKSVDHPAFFFFAGYGSADNNRDGRALLAYDSHSTDKKNTKDPPDIPFWELAKACMAANHLTVVIDAGFAPGDRYRSLQAKITARTPPENAESDLSTFYFGNICILSGGRYENDQKEEAFFPQCWEKEEGGFLTLQLMEQLDQEDSRSPEELVRAVAALNLLMTKKER